MNAKEFSDVANPVLSDAKNAVDTRAVKIASRLLKGDATPIYYRGQVLSRWGKKNKSGLGIYLIPLVLIPFALLKMLSPQPAKKPYAVGIRTYPDDMSFFQPGRSMDFFIGDARPEDVVFCAEGRLSSKRKQEFIKRGYTLIEPLKRAYLGDIRATTKAWTQFIAFAHTMDHVTRQTSMDILLYHLIWTGFLKQYSIGEYRVYNDIDPISIVRTILFNNTGTPIIWQIHSSNNWNQYEGGENVIEPELVDIVADEILVWDTRMRDHILRQTQRANKVTVTGCPWSSGVRKNRSRINVGVFDTSAGGKSPVSTEAMNMFIRDIIRIADDGRFYVLYKPKLETHIPSHPRIKIMADTTETLLFSDVVVAVPFTSPGVEAIQAGIPVLWFDPSRMTRGYYPVIHSYDELVNGLEIKTTIKRLTA